MPKLTEKQSRFVRAYAQHGNATRAADEAGYAHPNTMGPRLVKVRAVSDALGKLRDKAEKRAVLTLERKLELLAAIAEGTEGEDELSLSGDAVKVRPKVKDRIAAMALDSKLQGHMAPEKVDSSTTVTVVSATDEQAAEALLLEAARNGGLREKLKKLVGG